VQFPVRSEFERVLELADAEAEAEAAAVADELATVVPPAETVAARAGTLAKHRQDAMSTARVAAEAVT